MLKRGMGVSIVICLAIGFASVQSLSPSEALEQVQPLVAELAALRAVKEMQLSPEQAQKLLEISRKAQAVWSEYRERMREVLREQVEAFAAFRAEDLLNVGFTSETERKTAVANLRGKNLTKWLSDSLAPLAEEASNLLTDEQRSIAEQMHSTSLGTVLKVRLLPVSKRANSNSDLVAEIRRELAKIYRAEYGEITSLGRFLLNSALVSVLERQLGHPTSPIQPLLDSEFLELERTVKTLRTDINILNLINGLYMTPEQLRQLHELVQTASDYFPTSQATVNPVAFNELVRVLQGMRLLLINDRSIPQPMLLRAGQLARQAGLIPQSNSQSVELREIAAQVLSILTDEQKQVLIDYKPCLIPPKNLRDPVRVGQAPNNAGYIKALERLRQIPPNIYARRKAQIIEGLAKQIEAKGGPYPPEEKGEFVQRLTELVDRVRSLSDSDFAMKSEELAGEFRKLHRKDLLEERLKELTAKSQEEILLSKVVANLLHPRLTVVLNDRQLAQTNLKPGEGEGLKSLTVYNTGGICPKPQ